MVLCFDEFHTVGFLCFGFLVSLSPQSTETEGKLLAVTRQQPQRCGLDDRDEPSGFPDGDDGHFPCEDEKRRFEGCAPAEVVVHGSESWYGWTSRVASHAGSPPSR